LRNTYQAPVLDELEADPTTGELELEERHSLRRVAGLSTELTDVTEVEYRQLRLERVVLAGLWTSVCIVGPTLSAIAQGFEVYVITDACGDVSTEAHECAVTRMVQAGVRPMTSLQYLLELQRDWARGETYSATVGVASRFGGGYGIGLNYAKRMFGGQEGH